MSELNPCRFCGSTSLTVDSKSKRIGYNGLDAPVYSYTFSVRCNKCHARGPSCGGKVIDKCFCTIPELPEWAKTTEELRAGAIKKWNGEG